MSNYDPNKMIKYPIIVKDMVDIIKPLIDNFRSHRYLPDSEICIKNIIKRIHLLKKCEPFLFSMSKKYLGMKRFRLLKEILSTPKSKFQNK